LPCYDLLPSRTGQGEGATGEVVNQPQKF
jgi:hypothetical protein